jgi:hypothetical protein
MFRDRFYVSLVLTIPVVLYSGILRTLFGIKPLGRSSLMNSTDR